MQQKGPMAKTNTRLENLIASAEWQIELGFATRELARYLEDLNQREAGASLKDLGYEEEKANQAAAIIPTNTHQATPINSLGSSQDIPQGSIAHVKLKGVMRTREGLSSRSINQVTGELQDAYSNPNISGVILEVDSGGGEALAGTMLRNAIKERTKPVLAYVHNAASAAYKGIAGSDRIVTSGKESQVGSIGTMVQVNRKELDWYTTNILEVYAETSQNKNLEFRELQRGNIKPLIERLNKVDGFFIDAVKEDRKLTGNEETVADTVSGRIFDAVEARERGLVDATSTFNGAVESLRQIINQQAATTTAAGFFTNQNSNQMTFIERIRTALNATFNLGLAEDANEDQVVEAVESYQQDEQVSNLQETVDKMTDSLQALTEKIDQLTTKVEKQAGTIEGLEQSKAELEKQVVDLTGRKQDHKEGKAQTEAPKIEQFHTVQDFMKSMSPEGKSKY